MNDLHIAGIQKLSMVDYPGKMAAVIFFAGCNLRCPFCHNSELIGHTCPAVPADDVLAFLKKRANLLDGVVISGGEPTLQPITPFLKTIKQMGYPIKLDTNGFQPDVLQDWLRENLIDYIAMDIKNQPAKYAQTCGLPPEHIRIQAVRQSIRLIMHSGIPYEFRTTIAEPFHTELDMPQIGSLIHGADKYVLQAFVCQPTVPDQTLQEPSDELLKHCLQMIRPYVTSAEIRGRDITFSKEDTEHHV